MTPYADYHLMRRGTVIVPDILANAGGVLAAYFEWTQNIQQRRWKLTEVNRELEIMLDQAHAAVWRRSWSLITRKPLVALRRRLGSGEPMAFTDQVREWVRTGTEQTKRQVQRGRRWLDVRRLDRQIAQEHAALGRAVEHLLQDGQTAIEASTLEGHLSQLRQLRERRDAAQEAAQRG